ncbi:MAG: P-loop NTPase fold protein [Deltaproteobacteria bacterium]
MKDDPHLFTDSEEGRRLLGHEDFARSFAHFIQETPKDSLVGFWGDWGSGKSRIIKMAAEELAKSGVVVCVFNPWIEDVGSQWITLMTAAVKDAANQRLGELTLDEKKIEQACKAATKSHRRLEDINRARKLFDQITKKFSGAEPAKLLDFMKVEEVNQSEVARLLWSTTIKEVLKQCPNGDDGSPCEIVVFIDDVDRLTATALKRLLDECFGRLRRSVDDHGEPDPEVRFVVAADRELVLLSLKEILPGGTLDSAKRYLEKVLSIDVRVPEPTRE